MSSYRLGKASVIAVSTLFFTSFEETLSYCDSLQKFNFAQHFTSRHPIATSQLKIIRAKDMFGFLKLCIPFAWSLLLVTCSVHLCPIQDFVQFCPEQLPVITNLNNVQIWWARFSCRTSTRLKQRFSKIRFVSSAAFPIIQNSNRFRWNWLCNQKTTPTSMLCSLISAFELQTADFLHIFSSPAQWSIF